MLATLALPILTVVLHQQDLGDIEKMLAQKLEMKSDYALRFRFESRMPSAPEGSRRKWAYTAAIWRSGDKLRVDVFDREADPAGDESSTRGRHVTCRNCERQNYLLVTTVLPGAPKVTHQVEFHDPKTQPTDYFVNDMDWRLLGFCNARLAVYSKIPIAQSYRQLVADPLLKTSEQKRNGTPYLVTTIEKNKNEGSIWFDARTQSGPVLHTFTGDASKKGAMKHVTEVSWQKTAGGNMYPEKIKHTEHTDGALTYEEIITVQHADFDTKIDPTIFTLAGLDLNENQPIGYPDLTPGKWPIWKGGRADPSLSAFAQAQAASAAQNGVVEPEPIAPVAAYPVQSSTPLIVGLVSGGMSVTALGLAAIYRRRKG
ncbi:hypothetical protein R5W23_004964 [Gemmata sp. JC673]|uniref:Uncharacterized protein n=1 Tax=Gemmata algarum TaxID=2975278 RepID=A0ABU5EXA5_9BACT|nr:hypothetical protein [Gemmata algarum]MDY3558269.1 hypothetical protein [Gemmata algarum]